MSNISTLQQSLINAKKVMTKVEGGNFTKNESSLSSGMSNINMESVQQHVPQIPTPATSQKPQLTPKAHMTEERIKNSKLPEAIKTAMIKNPIPDIPFNSTAGLSEDFISGVKTQMEKQGIPTSPTNVNNTTPTSPIPTISNYTTKKITSKNLKSIIKESVKELLDETIGLKTDSNENFQFRVGDRIFYGKITSSKSIK